MYPHGWTANARVPDSRARVEFRPNRCTACSPANSTLCCECFSSPGTARRRSESSQSPAGTRRKPLPLGDRVTWRTTATTTAAFYINARIKNLFIYSLPIFRWRLRFCLSAYESLYILVTCCCCKSLRPLVGQSSVPSPTLFHHPPACCQTPHPPPSKGTCGWPAERCCPYNVTTHPLPRTKQSFPPFHHYAHLPVSYIPPNQRNNPSATNENPDQTEASPTC